MPSLGVRSPWSIQYNSSKIVKTITRKKIKKCQKNTIRNSSKIANKVVKQQPKKPPKNSKKVEGL